MRFSIVVPVYNTEKYLSDCIESVLAQNYDDYELILINDASTDNSLAICRRYENDHLDKIRVFNKPHNEGLFMARHTGIQLAKGEYIINLDSDDILSDGTLRILAPFCNGENDVVAYGYSRITSTGEKLSTHLLYEDVRKFEGGGIHEWYENIFYGHINSIWSKAYRSELLKKSLDDSFCPIQGEDIVRTLLVEPVKTAVYIGKPLYQYRVNEGSITKTYNFNKVFSWLKINRLLSRFSIEAKIDTPKACVHILRKNIYTIIVGILMACELNSNKKAYKKLKLLYTDEMCQEVLMIADQLKLGMPGMIINLFKHKEFWLLYIAFRHRLIRRVIKKVSKRRLKQ